MCRVARLGYFWPVAVGSLKFGYVLIATVWATFWITGDHLGMEMNRFWATFCQCLAPWLQKKLATLYMCCTIREKYTPLQKKSCLMKHCFIMSRCIQWWMMMAFDAASSAYEEHEFNGGEGTWADRTWASQARRGDKTAERQRRPREAEAESSRTQGHRKETDTEGREKAVALSSPDYFTVFPVFMLPNALQYCHITDCVIWQLCCCWLNACVFVFIFDFLFSVSLPDTFIY